eukprot:scaffold132105_cov57-Phaeocystis_antarctica.AAC.4
MQRDCRGAAEVLQRRCSGTEALQSRCRGAALRTPWHPPQCICTAPHAHAHAQASDTANARASPLSTLAPPSGTARPSAC